MASTTKIIIGIDGNEANVNERVGSNTYAFSILHAMYTLVHQRPELRVVVVLATPPVSDMPRSSRQWRYQIVKPARLFTQWALPLYLYRHRQVIKVFFTPGHYAPRWSPIPYVSSVMDLGYLRYPRQFRRSDLFQLKNWTAYSILHAKAIVAISNFTKQEVVETYHIPESDIVVAPPALPPNPPRPATSTTVLKKFNITAPFFLYVGTLQPRKNIIGLIEGFELFCKREGSSKTELVLAGKIGWLTTEIMQRIHDSPVQSQIILTGYVTESEKIALYKMTTALCLVAWYEGFGIPALEAMKYDCLPIVADTSSLPEVVGNAGLLINPKQPDSIATALYRSLRISKSKRAIYRRRMRQQVRQFSWQQSATLILDRLVSIATS